MTRIGNNFIAEYAKSSDLTLVNNSLEKVKNLSKQEVNNEKKIKEATNGFEALLLQEMFKSLWSTVETKGWMGETESNEAKIYRDMLNQALADSIASGKGIGIKDVVKKEFSKGSL
ncbi:MAG: rod-binding protein [Deltaproteobacteria bacterium]|jgi:flagellar protein FlgJ|nr:rod-binding protein [Deltaproteobacteria bacterium]